MWVLVDEDGMLLHRSAKTAELLGFLTDPEHGHDPFADIHPDDWDHSRQALARAVARPGVPVALGLRVMGASGQWHDLAVEVCDLRHSPDYRGIVVSGADVTERRLAEIAARVESRLLAALPTSVIVTDDDGTCVYWNEAATEIFGFRREEALGRPILELNIGPTGTEVARSIIEAVLETGRWEGDYDGRRADGSIVPIHTRLIRIEDPEIGFRGLAGAAIDISDRRRLEEDLAFQALHDTLTGLPNTHLFLQDVARAATLSSGSEHRATVLVLDIDGFAGINRRHGPVVSDEVLRVVARTVQLAAPDAAVARLHGDEFAACTDRPTSVDEAVAYGSQIAERLSEPFYAMGERTQLTATVGIAFADAEVPPGVLLRQAKSTMFEGKRLGRGHVLAFDPAMDGRSDERHALAARLAAALDAGRVRAAFQPQIDMATGEIVGFEALARWTDEGAAVEPGEFIPVAEANGLIGRVGDAVLRDACGLLADLIALVPEHAITMSVNLSPRQLADPAVPARLATLLEELRVPPGRICLEVTETALMETADALRALRQLKEVGVRLAIDDFGTGYSSLSRLTQFPLDHLKIDKFFVDQLLTRADNALVTASVITLADTLGIRAIAEGVEDEQQVTELLALGCRIGQGYLWSQAVDAAEAIDMVMSGDLHHDDTAIRRGVQRVESDGTIDEGLVLLTHELAQPTQVIAGFVDVLASGPPPDVHERSINGIRRANDRISSVVDLVRDARALDQGMLRLRRRRVSVAELVQQTLDATPACAVALDLVDRTLHVDVDRMAVCLRNLLLNAERHAGGTDLAVHAIDHGSSVSIHVLDRGPGVPAERVGRIFRRFGRADDRTPGSGLGLYVARGIARAHGGDVAYRRRRTGGSDFYVTIPMDRAGR